MNRLSRYFKCPPGYSFAPPSFILMVLLLNLYLQIIVKSQILDGNPIFFAIRCGVGLVDRFQSKFVTLKGG